MPGEPAEVVYLAYALARKQAGYARFKPVDETYPRFMAAGNVMEWHGHPL
jgi:hypothetical protein